MKKSSITGIKKSIVDSSKCPNLTRDVLSKELVELLILEEELKNRKHTNNPMNYNLPDLLFPKRYLPGKLDESGDIFREKFLNKEHPIRYKKRQSQELKSFIENDLYTTKDGRKIKIKLIPQQLEFLVDLFYGYTQKAIVWKCRGGGGSLIVAILIFLFLIYKQKSVLDLAGSKDQAKNVYNYVKTFWECFPDLKQQMLIGDPLISKTSLKSGPELRVLAASDEQVRGGHEPVLIIDEAAQKKRNKDDIFEDVMNGTSNILDHVIVCLSTFHVPVGFFPNTWDNAKKKNFKKFKWNIFDCLYKCDAGLDYATEKDPNALIFCQNHCPLTEKKEIKDDLGNITKIEFEGCNGLARNSVGFLNRETVIGTKALNRGTDKFRVEFECQRPEFSGPIFGAKYIEKSIIETLPLEKTGRGIVGIDWGYAIEGAIILLKDFGDYIGIVDGYCLSRKAIREWIDIIDMWQDNYSEDPLIIYADQSHQFNNLELEQCGYDIIQINFIEKVRDYLENNLLQYFAYEKIKISERSGGLGRIITQLNNYRRNPENGRLIKKDDHGPDAIEAAFCHYDFMKRHYNLVASYLKNNINKENEEKTEIIKL